MQITRLVPTALALLVVAQASCDSGPAVVLSQTPLWAIDGGPCFGAAGAVAGDLDGDGIDDLVVGTRDCTLLGAAPSYVSVYRGMPDGLAAEPITKMVTTGSFAFFDLDIGDIDGDTRDDLVIQMFDSSELYLGTPNLADIFATAHAGPEGFGVFFDANGDGDDEYLVGLGGKIASYNWNGMGFIASAKTLAGDEAMVAGDVDHDGRTDLYVTTDAGVDLYLGCVSAACVDALPIGPRPVPVQGKPIAVGDVNGDGRSDAVVQSPSQVASLHLADATGTLDAKAEWRLFPDPLYGAFRRIVPLGDVDGDGKAGDVGLALDGRTMVMFAGDAQPRWQWSVGAARDPYFGYDVFQPVLHRDLDDDGHQDVIFIHWNGLPPYSGRLVAYRGGQVPGDAPAPYLPTGFTCGMRDDTAQPDITVDRELMARSTRIRSAEFTAGACELVEKCVGAPGLRRLLDFSVAVQNLGGSSAILPGPAAAPALYQYDQCHGHDHLVGFAEYTLVDAQDQVVVAGHKQGYFPIDTTAYCDTVSIESTSFDYMTISAGWADVYAAGLACQWIDITDVPDGAYRLRVHVNKAGVIVEDNRLPNIVELAVVIAGDQVTVVD